MQSCSDQANFMCCYKSYDGAMCRSLFGPLHHVLVILIIELSRLGQLAWFKSFLGLVLGDLDPLQDSIVADF